LTKSILYESEEDFSPQNATFVALKGSAVPMDLSYVETKNHKHYAFLILGWGLISDVDILSESMRWMGEPRMTVAALYFLMAKRLYPGRLSMFTGVNTDAKRAEPTDAMFCRTTTADENSVLPPLSVPIATGDGWTVIEADFVLVWVLQTSHCSVNVFSGPGVTLDDGLFTIIVARNISRFDMLKLLLGIEDGSHMDHPNVDVYKASSYRLEPRTEKGIFSLDGEVVEYGPIQASVLPSCARTVSLAQGGLGAPDKKNN
jgi:sphingosine kinase